MSQPLAAVVSVEYPALQHAADAASDALQWRFMAFNIVQLAILSLIAFVAGWVPPTAADQRCVAIVVFILMLMALLVATALRLFHFDDRWFRCRAFAENIKSAVWFFVMSQPGANSDAEFLREIQQVRERLEQTEKDITYYEEEGPLITCEMKTAQALPFEAKIALFRRQRVDDQKHWYHTKAKANTKREKQWFAAIFSIEFVALGYAALQAWKLWDFNAVGGIAATSTAFIAWLQTKRFSDLGTSYAIAAGDLRRIAEEHSKVSDEVELKKFVAEVEQAVSREHSMWMARRVI